MKMKMMKMKMMEMIQIFLSRSREANFHVSFSSRFSRIGGKVSLSPLDFQDLKIISLSFLDPFLFHPTVQLVPDLILTLCQTKIAERESFYHSDFLSSRKFNIFANFSFSSQNWAKEFEISLSPLETGKRNSGFSFSSRMWRNCFKISLSLLDWAFLHLVND